MTQPDQNQIIAYIENNCAKLNAFLRAGPDKDLIVSEIASSCNPKTLCGRLEDLISLAEQTVLEILQKTSLRTILFCAVAGSRFLFAGLSRHTDLLRQLFVENALLTRKNRGAKEKELQELSREIGKISDLDKLLRSYKERDYLRVGIRDLGGLADVREVMAELSDLAGACVETAIDFHWDRLVLKHGRPPVPANRKGFVALGMGKISGRELNFSSDVDLVFLREPEEGFTSGPGKTSVTAFYEHLARSVAKSLSEVTEDGFAFRIDLRLRPEGDKGELVPSVTNAVDYYLSWGRTWERAVLMKAVPLAGDRDLGDVFLSDLAPFIYRKYLDYSTLEEMRSMKLQIESSLRRKPGINIKLGQGGIREIEFFVQALQLINAGRTPRAKSHSTLEALDLLRETGLLDKKTSNELKDAYIFFRKTEHRIQINHQLQTHELPVTEHEQEELARRMGYKNYALADFLSDLDRYRKNVEELFSSLFYQSGEGLPEAVSPDIRHLITDIDHEEKVTGLLRDYGFEDPASSYKILKGLVSPSDKKVPTDKGRRLLEKLAPIFIEELVKEPQPSQALMALDKYIDSLYAHSAYFSTLLENPATIRFISRILGGSRFFTDLLIRHPQAIDSLIAKGSEEFPKSKEALESELADRLAYCEGLEDLLDVLRRFKNEQLLVIGVHHLADEIDSPAARMLVSELAEVCLSGAVDTALQEMIRKFGYWDIFDNLPFVILGMGKLGGREMTYLSDLDVIFIYDAPEGSSIGQLSAHEWFSRFASRIISIINIPTAEGTVWAIDTRLRPSGNKGPLVSSLASFRDYHATSSQLWERQALIKAGPITGPQRLKDDLTDIINNCVMSAKLGRDEIAEMSRLRKRIECELALEDKQHVDVKTGHGGLIDVEFFVQANILKYAQSNPKVIRRNTLNALKALLEAGFVSESDYDVLNSGYRFLTNLEDRLRIMEHKSIDRMPLAGEKLEALARRLGYPAGKEYRLVDDYRRVTGGIRDIYNAFFG